MIRLSDMVPGHKMCCLCFEYTPYDELWIDLDGQKWDMCGPCGARETITRLLLDAGYSRGQVIDVFRVLTWRIREGMMEP